jgi:Zn-finger nucleic acid-binding protein
MLCPICNVDLLMKERQGIEIDYCPKCRGIWLDRKDLDEIIERSSLEPQSFPDRENRDLRSGKDKKADHE